VSAAAILDPSPSRTRAGLAVPCQSSRDICSAEAGVWWHRLTVTPQLRAILGKVELISDLITRLTGEPPGLQTINAAASALGEALGNRRILMVVDDAWREPDLRPFLQGGPSTTRLITTRLDNILPDNAVRQSVDKMQEHEAQALLV